MRDYVLSYIAKTDLSIPRSLKNISISGMSFISCWDEYEDEPEKVRMSEYLQVLKAYLSGKLTVDEAEDAKRCLQTKNSIRMETEYLRGQLQEIKQDMEVQNEVQKLEDGLDFLEKETGSSEDIQETVEVSRL